MHAAVYSTYAGLLSVQDINARKSVLVETLQTTIDASDA